MLNETGLYKRGFTLIEIIIVFALIGVLAAIGFPNMSKSSSQSEINSYGMDLITYLELARKDAIGQEISNTCDRFIGSQVEIGNESGKDYLKLILNCSNLSDTLVKVYFDKYPKTLVSYPNLAVGVLLIDFQPLTGNSNGSKIICLYNSKIEKYYKIEINQFGRISYEKNKTSCP